MGLDNLKVERFINAAMKYLGDKYSQPKRLEKGYSDCSSLIYKGLRDGDLLTISSPTISTKRMRDGDPRFKQILKSELQRGDILWGQDNNKDGSYSGHVAIYLGDSRTLEARNSGVVEYHNRPYFTRVYRIKSLEEDKRVNNTKKQVIENVEIFVNGKALKTKGYIVDGTTFIDVNKKAVRVRAAFEAIGAKVKWINNQVHIEL